MMFNNKYLVELLDLQLGTLEWGNRTLSILIYFFTTIGTFKTFGKLFVPLSF